jgi:hypothetical protein
MIRRILVAALFVAGTLSSSAQPSLPSSFQARTVHSPADADIFVRYGSRTGRRTSAWVCRE